MRSQQLAALLQQQGFAVLRYTEGDEYEDGEVVLTERISVQVPPDPFMPEFGVVVSSGSGDDQTFEFYDPTSIIYVLVQDIRRAMLYEKTDQKENN
jgi:hypothetical protein